MILYPNNTASCVHDSSGFNWWMTYLDNFWCRKPFEILIRRNISIRSHMIWCWQLTCEFWPFKIHEKKSGGTWDICLYFTCFQGEKKELLLWFVLSSAIYFCKLTGFPFLKKKKLFTFSIQVFKFILHFMFFLESP